MASSLCQLLRLPRNIGRVPVAGCSFVKQFSTSSPALARRRVSKLEEDISDDELYDQIAEPSEVVDSPSSGHYMLQEQRRTLHYLRLIEHEMPKLVAYRKPFVPPTAETPLIVRSIDYAGEPHPATKKRVIVAAVDKLPLEGKAAIHKFKLLAGPRWTPNPPVDGGVSGLEDWGNGYIKISCEDFPEPAMNLKWASDALDKLITEANSKSNSLSKLPIDMRHVYAKARKGKKGDHRSTVLNRASILDFPKEWLPSGARDRPQCTL